MAINSDLHTYKAKDLYNYKPKPRPTRFKRKDVNKPRLFLRVLAKHSKKFLLAFLVLSIIYVLYYAFFKANIFRVSRIVFNSSSSFVNEKELSSLIEVNSFGEYIFSVDAARLENISEDAFLGAKSISIVKVYPDTLEVTIEERVPLAIVYNPRTDPPEYFMVDIEGYLLGLVDITTTNLPKVEYYEPLQVGYFIDKDLTPLYLSLIGSLDKADLQASSISIDRREIKFYLDDAVETYLSRDKSIEGSVAVLDQLKDQLDLEGDKVNKIDLRYDKVVVQYDEGTISEKLSENVNSDSNASEIIDVEVVFDEDAESKNSSEGLDET